MKTYPTQRFEIPDTRKQVENPYDIDSSLLQDILSRDVAVIKTIRLNLTSAQTQGLEINIPGRAVVAYGYDTSNSTSIDERTVDSTAMIWCAFNKPLSYNPMDNDSNVSIDAFPLKHSRGFRGPFAKLFLYWPAQANTAVDLVIHTFKYEPWVNGESAT